MAGERLPAATRRELLLDVARDLLLDAGEAAITFGAVAERAEVTRALVYKHFENRDDLILQLQRRESQRVDRELSDIVVKTPGGFESKLRALVYALVASTDRWDALFAPLQGTTPRRGGRRVQRRRDRRAVKYFTQLAIDDLGVRPADASRSISMLLGGIDPLLAMVVPETTDAERRRYADLYVALVISALASLRD